MAKKLTSYNDQLRKAAQKSKQPTPLHHECPVCPEERHAVLKRQGAGWRCTTCRLLFLSPPPARGELPAGEECPLCAERGEHNILVWLDSQVMWCPACNYSREFLTGAQRVLRDQVARLAVGGCYGDSCKRPKLGGGKSSSGRKRGKGNPGYSLTTPLDLRAAPPARKDATLERASTRRTPVKKTQHPRKKR